MKAGQRSEVFFFFFFFFFFSFLFENLKDDIGENAVELVTVRKVFEFVTILIWGRNLSFYSRAWGLKALIIM